MILPGSYANGFAPRDGQPLYPELWRGCVGAWAPCLGPTGLTLRDWSGFGNHGILTNMDPATDWAISHGKTSLDLDGVNDRVQLPQMIKSNRFTISAWISSRYHNSSEGGGIFYQGSGVASIGTHLLYDSSYPLAFRWESGTLFVASRQPSLNTWGHVALSFNAGAGAFFVDGRAAGTFSTSAGLPSPQQSSLGVWYNFSSPERHFNGNIDDVRIYDRALLASEIKLLSLRRSIAYELAPRRRASVFLPSHLHYISGSSVRQGSIITGASPLGNVSKIQRAGDLSPIPEERFDDRRYYYS